MILFSCDKWLNAPNEGYIYCDIQFVSLVALIVDIEHANTAVVVLLPNKQINCACIFYTPACGIVYDTTSYHSPPVVKLIFD